MITRIAAPSFARHLVARRASPLLQGRLFSSSKRDGDDNPHGQHPPPPSDTSLQKAEEKSDQVASKDASQLTQKSKSTGVTTELRKDWLPDHRPWEGPKPASEIIKPFVEPYVYLSARNPKITDTKDEKMLEECGMHEFYTNKYPQFCVRENPMEYFRLPREYKKKAFEKAGIKNHLFEHMPEEFLTPEHSEILIIGGGIVGATIAYMIKYKARDSLTVMVIEKDPTYANAPWTMTHGGFRTQFSLVENILSARYFYDFLKSSKVHLSILEDEPPQINYVPAGFLFLSDLENAEKRLDYHQTQINQGAYVDVLNDFQLSQKFPWLNTEGIVIGTHGVEGEGWIDPWALFVAIKGRAEFLGVKFMQAEFLDWNPKYPTPGDGHEYFDPASEFVSRLIYRLPCGAEKQMGFGQAIVAAGVDSIDMAAKLGLGKPNSGIRSVPLPVEKRKRFYYVFNCPDAPIVDFPFLVDVPSGVWVRREGLGGNFICGKNPTFDEEPDPSNLNIDYQYFEKLIWPILVKRVSCFSQLQIVGAWASYIDYNYFDQSPIVGAHPFHPKIHFATGFSGYAMQAAPAVGRAIVEDILYDEHFDVNLTRFNWNRLLFANPLREEILV